MSLKGVAQRTLQLLADGGYEAPSGARVDLRDAIDRAVAGTRVYTPAQLERLLAQAAPGQAATVIEVTRERTQEAIGRLRAEAPGALNFASARNPGGGFVNGAKAQEEDLARCSALYPCLQAAPDYYAANRAESSLLYTDHVVHSPAVPFFQLRNRGERLEDPALASVITAPAPNAGQVLRRDPQALPRIEAALRRRAGYVLAVARAEGHPTLILGAWGCGVFQNLPTVVADAFGAWLEGPFQGVFKRVVFAVYGRDPRNREAFERRFT